MNIDLPTSFKLRLKTFLNEDEFQRMMEAYQLPALRAFRVFPSKIDPSIALSHLDFQVQESSLSSLSYVFDETVKIGKHPFYHGGALYPQEPSAALVIDCADIQPGHLVMDVCAAPGGKSLQILSALDGIGYCVSNEIDQKRVKVLMSNGERLGEDNHIILSMSSSLLTKDLTHAFDRVIVDAPCSGEGMYRKDIFARTYDSDTNVLGCALRQQNILEDAAKLVKQNGVLIYSTCTFNPTENELVIQNFLDKHPEFSIEPIKLEVGHSGVGELHSFVKRIYPFDGGEGQFIAKLRYNGANHRFISKLKHKPLNPKQRELLKEVFIDVDDRFYQRNDRIYFASQPSLAIAHPMIQDILVATDKGKYLVIEHASSKNRHLKLLFRQSIDLCEEEALCYLKGDVVKKENLVGWGIVCYHGVSLGLFKGDGSVCKNKYPKGLRNLGI